MINLSQQLRLGMKLTPQQVQYLKLLQLPTLVLEQRIKTELEINPMLELGEDQEQTLDQEEPTPEEAAEEETSSDIEDEGYTLEDYINDDLATVLPQYPYSVPFPNACWPNSDSSTSMRPTTCWPRKSSETWMRMDISGGISA